MVPSAHSGRAGETFIFGTIVSCSWIVEEFSVHVRGQPANSVVVAEFREDIDLFRRWVLDSELLTLRHHDGPEMSELAC